jgi:predicted RNA-binding protein with PUA-like domain
MTRYWLMKCEPDAYTIEKGSRLSVQPATKTEYDIVVRLGRRRRSRSG